MLQQEIIIKIEFCTMQSAQNCCNKNESYYSCSKTKMEIITTKCPTYGMVIHVAGMSKIKMNNEKQEAYRLYAELYSL